MYREKDSYQLQLACNAYLHASEKFFAEQMEKMNADPVGYSRNAPDFEPVYNLDLAVRNDDLREVLSLIDAIHELNYFGSEVLKKGIDRLYHQADGFVRIYGY
jgi:hypothetical protein